MVANLGEITRREAPNYIGPSSEHYVYDTKIIRPNGHQATTTGTDRRNFLRILGLGGFALSTTSCVQGMQFSHSDESLRATRPDLPIVPVTINLGKKPEEFRWTTIPYYITRPTQYLIDIPYFTDFAHAVDKLLIKEGGLIKALEHADVPSHYAYRLGKAASAYSEREVHNALKKMTLEQRQKLKNSLQEILVTDLSDHGVRVAIKESCKDNKLPKILETAGVSTENPKLAATIYQAACNTSEEELRKAVKEMNPFQKIQLVASLREYGVPVIDYNKLEVSVDKILAPEVRGVISAGIDMMIWAVVISAAAGAGPFSSGSKPKSTAPASGGGGAPPLPPPPPP